MCSSTVEVCSTILFYYFVLFCLLACLSRSKVTWYFASSVIFLELFLLSLFPSSSSSLLVSTLHITACRSGTKMIAVVVTLSVCKYVSAS